MECNRDEATRAKEIAERKFSEKDFTGAMKFAVKAKNLYPGLEGLPQMLATLDVHVSAENKIHGEADWYTILGVRPLADDDTIKKQYRKLALMLHPDKNKSIGADGAFKLISEAWSLLSDKTKRTAYDQKRFPHTIQQKYPYATGSQTVPLNPNGSHNVSSSIYSKVGVQQNTTGMGPPTAPHPSHFHPFNPNTFWTVCDRCKMQYEYQRVYLNHRLLCPNCKEPFLAVEVAVVPPNGSKSSTPWSFSQKHQNFNHHAAHKSVPSTGFTNSFNQTNFQWATFSKMAGSSAAASAPDTNVVNQAFEKVRKREEAMAASRKNETSRKNHASKKVPSGFSNASSIPDPGGDRPFKKRNINDSGRSSNVGVNMSTQKTAGNGGISAGSASGYKQGGLEKDKANAFSFANNKPDNTRELSQLELRNMLVDKARREISKKLSEWRSVAASEALEKEKRRVKETEEKMKQKGTVTVNGSVGIQKKFTESLDAKKEVQDKKASLDTSTVDLDSKTSEPVTISVPDPDFYEFDKDRTETSFAENQVWAAYDDDDGMPRYYALIHKVFSSKPFKIRISWLNSKTNSELGPVKWVESGFPKTCGDFRVGRPEDYDSLNSFSHRVSGTRGMRGAIHIYPRKGDVWALYQKWSPDWNELTPDEVVHKYDMVEVLSNYSEHGVSVTPLVKVAGFKTVFQRHKDPKEVKRIPREEMFRFSHQVPFYLLTGSEAPNAPKDCRELDPAATPLELLQIITEAKEDEAGETVEETVTDVKKRETVESSAKQPLEVPEEEKVANAKGHVKIVVKDDELVQSSKKEIPMEVKFVGSLQNIGKTYVRKKSGKRDKVAESGKC